LLREGIEQDPSKCLKLRVRVLDIHCRKVPDWDIPGSCFLCKLSQVHGDQDNEDHIIHTTRSTSIQMRTK
jgi:hypothetical protein